MVRVIKEGVACFNPAKSSFLVFFQRLLLVDRNTSQRDGRIPAEIMFGRKLRCPILSHYQPMQKLLYEANKKTPVKKVKLLFRKRPNTSLVTDESGRTILAHDGQIVAETLTPVTYQGRQRHVDAESTARPIRKKPIKRYPDVGPKLKGESVVLTILNYLIL